MKVPYLRLVTDSDNVPTRNPQTVLAELKEITEELTVHVKTYGLENTGEEWLLTELQEIEEGLRKLI